MRRVVITGIGLITPLGQGREHSWNALLASKSGAGRITTFDPSGYACEVACEVPRVDGRGGGGPDVAGSFDPEKTLSARDRRRVDDFILYALAAADEAVADSGWRPATDEQRERTGVLLGSGIGGLATIEATSIERYEKGPRKVSPFFIPSALINLASGHASIRYGYKGPNHAVVTACASGANALGDAARLIKYGDADIMLAGGAEAPICPVGIAGFTACRAMSTNFNDQPQRASRPYDRDRDGFVIGEGAGVLMVEEYEHALQRGAKIYCELLGYGMAGDAFHITAPAENGDGGLRAMRAAVKDAGIQASDIDYINAHGTSTPLGDEIELRAVERLLDGSAEKVAMSSTKSATGHLLGAAGAVEAAFAALAIRDQMAPPTINLDNPSVITPLDLVSHTAKRRPIEVAMSNSFGFGGTNASLILRRLP